MPGLQYVTTNFWKNPGMMSLFDADGNLLQQAEPIHTGSVTLPVNWQGDGQELVLLSGARAKEGWWTATSAGWSLFPDDGHPELAAAVLDLTGDPRDEVVLWDPDRVWIYTPGRPAARGAGVRARPQPPLQRLELPGQHLAARLGGAEGPLSAASELLRFVSVARQPIPPGQVRLAEDTQRHLVVDHHVAFFVEDLEADEGIPPLPVDGDQAEVVAAVELATRCRLLQRRQTFAAWFRPLEVRS